MQFVFHRWNSSDNDTGNANHFQIIFPLILSTDKSYFLK